MLGKFSRVKEVTQVIVMGNMLESDGLERSIFFVILCNPPVTEAPVTYCTLGLPNAEGVSLVLVVDQSFLGSQFQCFAGHYNTKY